MTDRAGSSILPTATIRPSRSPTSPVNASAPVPSTIVPPRITVSSTAVLLFVLRRGVAPRRVEQRQQQDVERGQQVAGWGRQQAGEGDAGDPVPEGHRVLFAD